MRSFRNTPRGLNGMSDNVRTNTRPVALGDILAQGNRAQRRWAKKKLADQLRLNAKEPRK